MNYDEKIEISTKRDYTVSKSNELVRNSRFALSLPEQKSVAFICSMIKPIEVEDRLNKVPFQLEYEFDIREYCKICGISYDSGKNYAEVKATLKKLRDRSIWLKLPDGSETTCGWLAKVTTNKKSGIVKIKIDEDLVPYLFDLGQKFTAYRLFHILGMQSAYSVRIYELMKSYAFQKSKTYDLDELKKILMVEDVKSYENFKDFRKKVLEISMKEINELTDLRVTYETIKKGNKVVKIKFRIQEKDPLDRYDSMLNTQKLLEEK